MAEAVESAAASASGVAFELDRIEAGSDRLEVNGRWFGVRGRRFIRPSLTLLADEEQKRLLASLDHKPWAAEDGEPWRASFPYEQKDEQWLEAELNVAPDITVSVPLPGSRPARRRRSNAAGSVEQREQREQRKRIEAHALALGRAGQGAPRNSPCPARARAPRGRDRRALGRAVATRRQARRGFRSPRCRAQGSGVGRRRARAAHAGARRSAEASRRSVGPA